MTKGTCTLGLPSASITPPKGFSSRSTNGWGFRRGISFVAASRRRPMLSRAPQRSEAITSSEVTGLPSENSRPGRRVKVQVSLSSLTCQPSSICGLYSPLLSIATSVS